MRITSDDYDLGVNEGNLCVKGKFGHEFINSDKRVKTPLIRKGGKLCPVSWDDALEYVSNRFNETIKVHGGKAIGGIGSEKCTNEDNYLFQKFCRTILRTNNIDNISNMKSPSLNRLIIDAISYKLVARTLEEIENADTIFFVGADVTEAHPVLGSMARKAIRQNKSKLIIANARNVEFNSVAKDDIRLNYKLGTQTILINALIKIIVDSKLVDLKKVDTSTKNLKELRALLKTSDLGIKKASSLTNIPEELIKNASEWLAKPGKCYVVCGKDLEEDPSCEEAIKALMNLCALINTGGADKVSLVFSRANNNSQGVNDMGVVPDFLPGYADINDPVEKGNLEDFWGAKIPDCDSGSDGKDIFDLAVSKKIKALYVMGENPIVNYPDGKKVKDAFKKAEFVVVQDSFLTETAQLADVVLPSSSFVEKGGTFTNMGMTIQRLHKAISQVGDSKPDWQIINDLAKHMGHSYSYTTSQQIVTEIESSVHMYKGIEVNKLERKGFRWISSEYRKFRTATYNFENTVSKPTVIKKNTKYPFVLLTGSSLKHQGTYSRNSGSLVSLTPECFVEINRKNAEELNIEDGDKVKLESARGKINLNVKISKRVPVGAVFVSEDYEWVPVNSLRDNGYTNVKISKVRK
jgi:formate dehydrogenase alpha subunit